MKNFFQFMTYVIFRVFVFLFRIVPLRILYFFSDIIFLIFFYLIGYRKKVVFSNLRNSFPEKTEAERKRIARNFYCHLCDILIESIKAFSMKEPAVVKRYQFKNVEPLDVLYRQQRPVIVVAGHFNNWEWAGIAAGNQLLHKPVGFYKPLSNRYVDDFVKKTRVQGRSALVSITETVEVFKTDWGETPIFYMVADQSPASTRLAYWIKFLNQDTATLHGPEKYARVYNYPVFYADIQKINRGYYTVEFLPLCLDPASTKTGEITLAFMQLLEKKIRENPQYYLWSHKRWKHKREQR